MFIQSIKDYPTLYVILLGAVIICVFLWILAMHSSKKRRTKRDTLIARLEHEAALRREFREPTQQQLIDTPPERLIEGLSIRIQSRLDALEDMQAAYKALPEHERLIYALGYVIQDGRENLSGFFKAYGPPLTDAALEAVLRFLDETSAGIFQKEFDAFDERNEVVSLVRDTIDSLDTQWHCQKQEAGDAFYREAKEFILTNFGVFI